MPMAQDKDVRLVLDASWSLPRYITTDAGRLRQVLLNLVGNGIKFAAGKHGAQPAMVILRVMPLGDQEIEFTVIDNGIGISEEKQKTLFQPFTQVHKSPGFGGTGLGLAISSDLIKLMGGNITVESREGSGATFKMVLPFQKGDDSHLLDLPDKSVIAPYHFAMLSDDEISINRYFSFCEYWQKEGHVFETLATLKTWLAEVTDPVCLCISSLSYSATKELTKEIWETNPEVKILDLTTDAKVRLGSYGENLYVERRSPMLPSRLVTALETLMYKQPKPVQEPEQAAIEPGKGSVLLVEDNQINQDVMLRQLALLGFGAEAASDGLEGLRLWREGSYDLVLTDCQMPVMDGFEMVHQIRADEKAWNLAPVPIIGISANALKGEAERCKAAGMSDFLSKPATLEDLRSRLEIWTAQRPQNAMSDGT